VIPSYSILLLLGEKRLTAAARHAIQKKDFALPGEHYPIEDKAHAVNALARSSGKSIAGRVKAKVCSKYPGLPSCKEAIDALLEDSPDLVLKNLVVSILDHDRTSGYEEWALNAPAEDVANDMLDNDAEIDFYANQRGDERASVVRSIAAIIEQWREEIAGEPPDQLCHL
jgi:hypothetical protein